MKIGFWFHMMYFLCLPKTLFILSRWSLMSPPRQRGRGNLGSASFIPWATCLKFQCFCKSCVPLTSLRVIHSRWQQYNHLASYKHKLENGRIHQILFLFIPRGLPANSFVSFLCIGPKEPGNQLPFRFFISRHLFQFEDFSIKVCIFSYEFSILYYDVVASPTSLHHCGSCTSQDFWKPSHPLFLSSHTSSIKSFYKEFFLRITLLKCHTWPFL